MTKVEKIPPTVTRKMSVMLSLAKHLRPFELLPCEILRLRLRMTLPARVLKKGDHGGFFLTKINSIDTGFEVPC
jgi:hypothetical protein